MEPDPLRELERQVERGASSGGTVPGWILSGADPQDYTIAVDTEVKHGGKASASLRAVVPEPFAASISADAHSKAADYTIAKLRLGRIGLAVDTALVLALTIGGGLAAFREIMDRRFRTREQVKSVLATECLALVPLLADSSRKGIFSKPQPLALEPRRPEKFAIAPGAELRSICLIPKIMRTIIGRDVTGLR